MTLGEQRDLAAALPAEVRAARARAALRTMQRLAARQRRRRDLEHVDLGEAGA